jgi:hypothetical protein
LCIEGCNYGHTSWHCLEHQLTSISCRSAARLDYNQAWEVAISVRTDDAEVLRAGNRELVVLERRELDAVAAQTRLERGQGCWWQAFHRGLGSLSLVSFLFFFGPGVDQSAASTSFVTGRTILIMLVHQDDDGDVQTKELYTQ